MKLLLAIGICSTVFLSSFSMAADNVEVLTAEEEVTKRTYAFIGEDNNMACYMSFDVPSTARTIVYDKCIQKNDNMAKALHIDGLATIYNIYTIDCEQKAIATNYMIAHDKSDKYINSFQLKPGFEAIPQNSVQYKYMENACKYYSRNVSANLASSPAPTQSASNDDHVRSNECNINDKIECDKIQKYVLGVVALGTEQVERIDIDKINLSNKGKQFVVRTSCGSSGCRGYILNKVGNGYKIIHNGMVGEGVVDGRLVGISLLKTSTNGFTDIELFERNGWEQNYDIYYKYDGNKYVESKSITRIYGGDPPNFFIRYQGRRDVNGVLEKHGTIKGKVIDISYNEDFVSVYTNKTMVKYNVFIKSGNEKYVLIADPSVIKNINKLMNKIVTTTWELNGDANMFITSIK